MAFGTFGGLVEFPFRELKSTGTTTRRLDDCSILGVLETAQKMVQVIGDSVGRLIHRACNLINGHWIAEQQVD